MTLKSLYNFAYNFTAHMESRVCTKTYSEECYTEFCNRTTTWKITCPCKGNMCNVRDVPQERKLFDILNQLVDKTFKNYRFKRSNIVKYKTTKEQLHQDRAEQNHVVKRSLPISYHINEQNTEQDTESTLVPSVMPTTTATTWAATTTTTTMTASPIPLTTQYTTPLKTTWPLKPAFDLRTQREEEELLNNLEQERTRTTQQENVETTGNTVEEETKQDTVVTTERKYNLDFGRAFNSDSKQYMKPYQRSQSATSWRDYAKLDLSNYPTHEMDIMRSLKKTNNNAVKLYSNVSLVLLWIFVSLFKHITIPVF